MSWLSKTRIRVIFPFIACSFLLVSCSSFAPGKICTLVGCLGGISVDILGLQDGAEYQVSLIMPSDIIETLTCNGGVSTDPFKSSCTASGAFFALEPDISPPGIITVEVVVDGRSYSKEFQPDYEKIQPNGEGCSPVCYSASITYELSK